MKIMTRARVKNGRCIHASASEVIAAVRAFDGKSITITFEEAKRKRSNAQNDYYWHLLGLIAKETGYRGTQELHEKLKYELNGETFITPDGHEMRMPRSTAKLAVGEFSAYIERVKEWARDFLGMVLPEAEEIK